MTHSLNQHALTQWRLYRGSRLDPTVYPPRSDDTVVFESDNAYHVFSDAPLTNVDEFVIAPLESLAGPGTPPSIDSCADLPAEFFSQLDCSRFFISDQTRCFDHLSFFDEDSGQRECMYFNSCPTEAQAAEQRDRVVDAAIDVHAQLSQARAAVEALEFEVGVALADIAPENDADAAAMLAEALQDEAFVDQLTAALTSSINGAFVYVCVLVWVCVCCFVRGGG